MAAGKAVQLQNTVVRQGGLSTLTIDFYSEELSVHWVEQQRRWAAEGYRVIALASRTSGKPLCTP